MFLRSSLIIRRSTNLLSTEFRHELKHDVACFTRDCTVPTTISVDIYENLWSELVIFTYTLISVTAVAPSFHRGGVLLSPRWRFPSTAVTGLFEGFVWRKDSTIKVALRRLKPLRGGKSVLDAGKEAKLRGKEL